MFTITLTAQQLEFLQALIINAKGPTGFYNRSDGENELIDGCLTLIETATSTGS